MLRVLVLLTAYLIVLPVYSDDVVESSKAALGKLTDQIQQQALDSSADAISRIDNQGVATPLAPTPELFNQISQSSGQPIDIDNLANQGQRLFRSVDESAKRYESQVLIFISSSMPDQTVIHYLQQARRIKASLVLRGFVGDTLLSTKQYIYDILMGSSDPDETHSATATVSTPRVPISASTSVILPSRWRPL